MQNVIEDRCLVCGNLAQKSILEKPNRHFYECPVCGRYQTNIFNSLPKCDLNHLSFYLFYNKFNNRDSYYSTLSQDLCEKWQKEYKEGNKEHGYPVKLEMENIEIWYPKTFAEKTDKILLYLSSKIKHFGSSIELTEEEIISLLFVDRYDIREIDFQMRHEDEIRSDFKQILSYFQGKNLLRDIAGFKNTYDIMLSPESYSRVDELQKTSNLNSRNVLVAMKFGSETKKLREAIRIGISNAGYNPIFIDEVEHNNFITPELLKFIKDSKFVVVDLTHQNNGAYFEEGYAMGLGKPVIQLCKDGVQLHFDIAQKNTILWKQEDEIPIRLSNRIKATVE